MDGRPIGVFDSGMGGVSVLIEIRRLLPGEDLIYYGDTKNAPYGDRDEEEIRRLVLAVVDQLLARDVKALVIACNTMTSAAAAMLRERLDIPVVGMEPALKPAALSTSGGEIAVMATTATLRQDKFRRLMALYGSHALMVPCPGLMDFVERGDMDSEELDGYLENLLSPYRSRPIRAVVLGCTHYLFLRDAIARAIPQATIYDGNHGTAKRLQALLAQGAQLSDKVRGETTFLSSEDTAIPRMQDLFARGL